MLRKYFIFFIFFNFTCITFAQDNSIKMKSFINLEIAKIMVDACESHQKKTGYRTVNTAIVESKGDLILFRRQHNSFLLSIDIAIAKANSLEDITVPTKTIQDIVYEKYWKPGRVAGLSHSKNIVAFPEGLPIKTKNSKILGAIGVSSATVDEDKQCANAALLAVDEYL